MNNGDLLEPQSNVMEREPAPRYELGYCPVCGYHGWEGVPGDDYDDCKVCGVDFCQFVTRSSDPLPLRAAWLAREGLTFRAFVQLTRNLQVEVERPATWPQVIFAAADGNAEEVAAALNAGEDVNATNERGETALMWAAYLGHRPVVELLIARGANLSQRFSQDLQNATAGVTALLCAVRTGQTESVRLLLAADNATTLNQADAAGITPLMAAAIDARLEIAKLLVASGAVVDQQAKDGRTALAMAAGAHWPELVEVLLAAGADVDSFDAIGDRPLIHALRNWDGERDRAIAVANRLLDAGADPAIPAGDEPDDPLCMAIELQDVRLVRRLIERGAPADAHSCRNPISGKRWVVVPLVRATSEETCASRRIMRLLLKMGVDLNARDTYGLVPLGVAVVNENWKMAGKLIQAGASLETDYPGVPPLVIAVQNAPQEWSTKWLLPRVGQAAIERARNFQLTSEEYEAASECARQRQEAMFNGEPDTDPTSRDAGLS